MIVVSRYDDDLEQEYKNLKDDYGNIIDFLEENTDYIELANFKYEGQESSKDMAFYNMFKDNIREKLIAKKWAGTADGGDVADLYRINSFKEFFDFMREQKFFFRVKRGSYLFDTLESQGDLAFYTKDNICLLYTTTEEAAVGIYNEELEKIALGK